MHRPEKTKKKRAANVRHGVRIRRSVDDRSVVEKVVTAMHSTL